MADDRGSGDRARELSKTVCLVCRQRKVKCDRRLPTCTFCSKHGHACRWVAAHQKPGLRAGYVSELEKRLTILENEVRELKTHRSAPPDPSPRPASETSPSTESFSLPPSSPDESPPPSNQQPFDPLLPPVLNELCDLWFHSFHPWFPILHQPSILDALHSGIPLADSEQHPVFKAIVAVTITNFSPPPAPSLQERQACSATLRNEVVTKAVSTISIQSLQSLLLLTITSHADGNLSELWNLVALCKRISTQLGLHDLVVNKCANFNQVSTIPPRMLPLPSTLVSQEEDVRAYWMTEVLDASSTIGAAWNLSLSRPLKNALLPCNNEIWAFPESAMGIWSFDDLEFSSSFSLYIGLVTNELWHVHNFLQQAYDFRSAEDRTRAREDCQKVDARLLEWQGASGAVVFSSNHALYGQNNPSFDPNILMSRCTFNAAVIAMYQRVTVNPHSFEHLRDPWYPAIQRCLDCSNDIAAAVRSVDDSDLETTNSQLSFCIFVAARFLIEKVYAKHFNLEVPRNLDLLAYALQTSGQRWPIARRLERVIRTAIAEYRMPLSMGSMPSQFYDLQYSAIDIDDALRIWANNVQPWVHLLHTGVGEPSSAVCVGETNFQAQPLLMPTDVGLTQAL